MLEIKKRSEYERNLTCKNPDGVPSTLAAQPASRPRLPCSRRSFPPKRRRSSPVLLLPVLCLLSTIRANLISPGSCRVSDLICRQPSSRTRDKPSPVFRFTLITSPFPERFRPRRPPLRICRPERPCFRG